MSLVVCLINLVKCEALFRDLRMTLGILISQSKQEAQRVPYRAPEYNLLPFL